MFSVLFFLASLSPISALSVDTRELQQPFLGDKGPVSSDIVLSRPKLSWVGAALCAEAMYDKDWLKKQLDVHNEVKYSRPYFNVYTAAGKPAEEIPESLERTKTLKNYKLEFDTPWWHAGYTAAMWTRLEIDRRPMEDQKPCVAMEFISGLSCATYKYGEATSKYLLEDILETFGGKRPIVITAGQDVKKLIRGRSYAVVKVEKDGDGAILTIRDPMNRDYHSFAWDDIKEDLASISAFREWRD